MKKTVVGLGAFALVCYGLYRLVKRDKTLAVLRGFALRVDLLQSRFIAAFAIPPLDLSLHEEAKADPEGFLSRVSLGIRQEVAYATDQSTHGEDDFWQSPDETLRTGRGDCEDQALLALDTLYRAGFTNARLAVGTYEGDGHAWVEFAHSSMVLDPTGGLVARRRPSGYEPAVWLGPYGPSIRSDLAS